MVIFLLLGALCLVKGFEFRPVQKVQERCLPRALRYHMLQPVLHPHKGPMPLPPHKEENTVKKEVKIPREWYDDFLEWQQKNSSSSGS